MSKGISGIKGYHGGGGVTHTHGPKNKKKKKKTTTTPDTSAYQQAAASGYMGAGYIPKEIRQKTSGFDPTQYPSGVLTETGAGGGQQVTYNVLDDDKAKTVITPPKDDKPPKEDKKEQVKYYDDELGGLSERDLFLLEKKLGQKAIIKNGKIFFVDETGSTVPAFAMIDKLGGVLDKFTGFDPTKAFGDMGDTGKAALFNKISNMSGVEFQEFLNRKGNLDRLLNFAEEGGVANKNRSAVMAAIKNNDPSMFANLIKGSGGEGFDKELLKIQNPQKYYELNPPRTSGDLEEAAMAGVSYIPGYGPVERPDRGGQQSGGGISNFQTSTPTPPATDTTVPTPDFLLKRQYMPNFTPNYLGGPEQMQVAGGYYDPVTKKFIGNPYGTASQYQFAQGGIVGTSPLLFKNQGGMASNKGIKSFKNYGY